MGGSDGGGAGGGAAAGGTAPSTWGSQACPNPPAAGSGYAVGSYLAPVPLKTCEGEDVTLDDICGSSAAWVLFAHGWCPHCQKASGLAESIQGENEVKGVAVVNVLVQTASSKPPGPADCLAWRQKYGHDKVVTLYDPDLAKASQKLWDNNYTALSVFVNQQHVITSKSHTDVKAQIQNGIDGALTSP